MKYVLSSGRENDSYIELARLASNLEFSGALQFSLARLASNLECSGALQFSLVPGGES